MTNHQTRKKQKTGNQTPAEEPKQQTSTSSKKQKNDAGCHLPKQ
jgi:hypothetical protein